MHYCDPKEEAQSVPCRSSNLRNAPPLSAGGAVASNALDLISTTALGLPPISKVDQQAHLTDNESDTLQGECAAIACAGFSLLEKAIAICDRGTSIIFESDSMESPEATENSASPSSLASPYKLLRETIASSLILSPTFKVRDCAKHFLFSLVSTDHDRLSKTSPSTSGEGHAINSFNDGCNGVDENECEAKHISTVSKVTRTKLVSVLVYILPIEKVVHSTVRASYVSKSVTPASSPLSAPSPKSGDSCPALFDLLCDFVSEIWMFSSKDEKEDVVRGIITMVDEPHGEKHGPDDCRPPPFEGVRSLGMLFLWLVQEITALPHREFRRADSVINDNLRSVKPEHNTEVDSYLVGLLTLASRIMQMINMSDAKRAVGVRLIPLLVEKFAFILPSNPSWVGVSTKFFLSPPTREASRKFLLTLCANCAENVAILSSLLQERHHDFASAGPRQDLVKEWFFDPIAKQKSVTGFVGMKNQGATCYMNSLLQQFFLIPALRQGLLSCCPRSTARSEGQGSAGENGDDDKEEEAYRSTLLFQMQYLFAYLMLGERRQFDARDLVSSIRGYDGNPIRPGEQQDVDEFFNLFCDRLETSLKPLPQKRLLQDVFGGQLSHLITCQQCKHSSERVEDSLSISLDVKGKANVNDSLKLYIQGESLDGANQYFCSKCQSKQDSIKMCCLKSLPNTLILHLKRFEFDLETMRKIKVNDRLEYPVVIDMKPYTKEGIAFKENPDFADASLPSRPDGYYRYQLKGVLVHQGTADSGHYYSIAKERGTGRANSEKADFGNCSQTDDTESWYCFNDSLVTSFDPATLPDATFGGKGPLGGMDKPFSAYLLFYEREVIDFVKKDDAAEGENQSDHESRDEDTADGEAWHAPYDRLSKDPKEIVPADIFDEVCADNYRFIRDQTFFDPSYTDWLLEFVNLSTNVVTMDGAEAPPIPLELTQAMTMHLFENLFHARDRSKHVESITSRLSQSYLRSKTASLWLLELMSKSYKIWPEKIFLHCHRLDVRRHFTVILSTVFQKVAESQRALYHVEDMQCSLRDATTGGEEDDDSEEFVHDTDDDVIITNVCTHRKKQLGRAKFWMSKSVLARFVGVGLLDLFANCPKEGKLSTELFDAIYAFGCLGHTEAIYLIRCGLVLRLTDIYLGENSGVPSKSLMVGVATSGDGKDSATTQRRIRDSFGNKQSFYALINLLSLLLRSTILPREDDVSDSDDSDSDYSCSGNDDTEVASGAAAEDEREGKKMHTADPFPPTLNEKALVTFRAENSSYEMPSRDSRLLTVNEKFIKKIFEEDPITVDQIPLTNITQQIVAHLCQDNMDGSKHVCKIAQDRLIEKKAEEFSLSIDALVRILKMNDKCAPERVPEVIKAILAGLKANVKWEKECRRILCGLQHILSERTEGPSGMEYEVTVHGIMIENLDLISSILKQQETNLKVKQMLVTLVRSLLPRRTKPDTISCKEIDAERLKKKRSPAATETNDVTNAETKRRKKDSTTAANEKKMTGDNDNGTEVGQEISLPMQSPAVTLRPYENITIVRRKVLSHLVEIFPVVSSDLKKQSENAAKTFAANRGPYVRHYSLGAAPVDTNVYSEYFVALRECLNGDDYERKLLLTIRGGMLSLLFELDRQGRHASRPPADIVKGELIWFYETLLDINNECGLSFFFDFISDINLVEKGESRSPQTNATGSPEKRRKQSEDRIPEAFTKLLEMYVTTGKQTEQYNRTYTFRFYNLLLLLADSHKDFRDYVQQHGNWTWALNAFILGSSGSDSTPLFDPLFCGSVRFINDSHVFRDRLLTKYLLDRRTNGGTNENVFTQSRLTTSSLKLLRSVFEAEKDTQHGSPLPQDAARESCIHTFHSAGGLSLISASVMKFAKRLRDENEGCKDVGKDGAGAGEGSIPFNVVIEGLYLSLKCLWMALQPLRVEEIQSILSSWPQVDDINILCTQLETYDETEWQKCFEHHNIGKDEIKSVQVDTARVMQQAKEIKGMFSFVDDTITSNGARTVAGSKVEAE